VIDPVLGLWPVAFQLWPLEAGYEITRTCIFSSIPHPASARRLRNRACSLRGNIGGAVGERGVSCLRRMFEICTASGDEIYGKRNVSDASMYSSYPYTSYSDSQAGYQTPGQNLDIEKQAARKKKAAPTPA
jgi:hypothetical protein